MRFEESLLDDQIWKDVAESGCKYLHFGYESGNQRVLKLMDKATKLDAIETNLRMSSEAGIWNHLMGFLVSPEKLKKKPMIVKSSSRKTQPTYIRWDS